MPLIKNIFANMAWTLLRSPANPRTHTTPPLCSYWSASTFTVHKKSPVFTIFKKAGHNSQKIRMRTSRVWDGNVYLNWQLSCKYFSIF